MWEFVKEIPELLQYFPDYTPSQWPDKDYLFSVLSELRGPALKELVVEARKKRSIYEEPEIGEYVEVTDQFKQQISEIFTQKSRYLLITSIFQQPKGRPALCSKKAQSWDIVEDPRHNTSQIYQN